MLKLEVGLLDCWIVGLFGPLDFGFWDFIPDFYALPGNDRIIGIPHIFHNIILSARFDDPLLISRVIAQESFYC
jgi:hypothetical protein